LHLESFILLSRQKTGIKINLIKSGFQIQLNHFQFSLIRHFPYFHILKVNINPIGQVPHEYIGNIHIPRLRIILISIEDKRVGLRRKMLQIVYESYDLLGVNPTAPHVDVFQFGECYVLLKDRLDTVRDVGVV
jgi:hypothetical protein